MGWLGKKTKNATDSGHLEPMENLPVATLVSEETSYHNMPQPSAPLSPFVGHNSISGGDRYAEATSSSSNKNSETNIFANDPTLSRFPLIMSKCPYCNSESRTRVTTAPSWKTWAAGGCLFFVFWPLCWLPLVVDSCKTTEHFCVKCGVKVAKIDAFKDCCVEHRG